MLSISGFIKAKPVNLLNSGLSLTYYPKKQFVSMEYEGYDIGMPISADTLEIVNLLTNELEDARSGSILQSAWENPIIQDLNKSINSTKKIAISYYILLTFLRLGRTRDIWLAFRGIHHSLLSYLRNRAVNTQLLMMRYKVALLSCHLNGYGLRDIAKIQRTFEKCGLHGNNYIFYLLLVLDGLADNLTFDTQDTCVLSVPEMESETKQFIDTPSILRLSMYHTYKKLRFIVESQKISPEDMSRELVMATQVAYTTIRPFKTKEYSENYARRAMTNTVNRIIHAYTTYPSLMRLISTEEGSVNTHVMITETTSGYDSSYDADIVASMRFNEDALIEHLDRYRTRAVA